MYFSENSSTTTDAKNADTDAEYAPSTSLESHFPTKKELDDLIRNLGLMKSGAELLTSRLNEWNLLGDDCKSRGDVGPMKHGCIFSLAKRIVLILNLFNRSEYKNILYQI